MVANKEVYGGDNAHLTLAMSVGMKCRCVELGLVRVAAEEGYTEGNAHVMVANDSGEKVQVCRISVVAAGDT